MLFNICDSNKVTIFWDKPENFSGSDFYRVLLNGEEIGKCDKTHYTALGLEPETEYTFYVEFVKQWGYVRLYYKDELLTVDNTEFINVSNTADVNSTSLYVGSDDNKYKNGQINFAYTLPTTYVFEYDPTNKVLTVTCLDDKEADTTIDTSIFESLDSIRLSSLYLLNEDSLSTNLKFEVPSDDTYTITTDELIGDAKEKIEIKAIILISF